MRNKRGGFMLGKRFLAGLLLLLTAACAGTAAQGPASPSYDGAAETLKRAVATYRALEPKLTADQKEEFREAYAQLCKSYQTAGILLASAMDSEDPANTNTALLAFQRTVAQLPAMADRISQVARGFEAAK